MAATHSPLNRGLMDLLTTPSTMPSVHDFAQRLQPSGLFGSLQTIAVRGRDGMASLRRHLPPAERKNGLPQSHIDSEVSHVLIRTARREKRANRTFGRNRLQRYCFGLIAREMRSAHGGCAPKG